MTDQELYEIWTVHHKQAGWVEIARLLGCDEGDVKKLEEWDTFLNGLIESKPLTTTEAKEIFGTWDQARTEYLDNEIGRCEEQLKTLFEVYREDVENETPGADRLAVIHLIHKVKKRKRSLEYMLAFIEGKGGNQVDINGAKQRDIGEFMELKNGRGWCPFHEGNSPAFSVKNGHGHCFSCGWSGDVIDFIQAKNGVGFVEAVKFLTA